MKAVVCRELGPPTGLRVMEWPDPAIGGDGVRVRLHAASVNFPDILMVAGGYQHRPELPFIPGIEGAGEIIEVGENVHGWQPGDKVMAHARTGAFAEQMVVPAINVEPLPTRFSFEEGAAFGVAFKTAITALVPRGRLRAGETLLVHGAAGGVGLAAVELGKYLGAKVIAVVGDAAKQDAVRACGADEVLIWRNGADLRDAVKELTGGRGADVIYDPVGGDIFDASIRCIGWRGRLLVVGFAGGRLPTVAANLVLLKGCDVIGVRAGEFALRQPERAAELRRELHRLAESGFVRPRIFKVLPLDRVVDAMDLLSTRQVIGKAVLRIGKQEG